MVTGQAGCAGRKVVRGKVPCTAGPRRLRGSRGQHLPGAGWVGGGEGRNTGLAGDLPKEPLDPIIYLSLLSWKKARYLHSAEVGSEGLLTPRYRPR